MERVDKILNRIFAMHFVVLILFAFLVSIATATFIENDYGRPVAQKLIFKTWWFEGLIVFLFLAMLQNINRYKLLQWKKISSLLFHCAFLVIIVGAAFTRYFGFEGVMSIREGGSSNEIISSETSFQLKVHDSLQQHIADIPLIMEEGTDNYFDYEFFFPGETDPVRIEFVSLLDNVKDTLIRTAANEGLPFLEIVTVGSSGRNYNYLKTGDVISDGGYLICFNTDEYPEAISAFQTDSGLCVKAPFDLPWFQMADSTSGFFPKDTVCRFVPKRLYSVGSQRFVLNAYYPSARLDVVEKTEKENVILKAVTVKVSQGELSKEVMLRGGSGFIPGLTKFRMGSLYYEMAFGSRVVHLPFSIYLRDFQLDRYPGTDAASSFASEVTLVDPEMGYTEDRRIFMNNVLDYRGYRFFQSSYDLDEGGTVLSVNQDRLGTWTTYIGYILLGLGFVINLISPNSRFRMLLRKAREVRLKREALGILVLLLVSGWVESVSAQQYGNKVDYEHAEKYGRLIVQDVRDSKNPNDRGRFKPVHTFATEVLRKVHRSNSYEGLSPMQVFLGIHSDPVNWQLEPLIYVSGDALREKFHCEGKYAPLADFFSLEYDYLLAADAEKALLKKPAEQSQYDKDVLKTGERVNLLYGLFAGWYLKILPLPNDSTNSWYSPYDIEAPFQGETRDFVRAILPLYVQTVKEGGATGDWTAANRTVDAIDLFQRKTAPENLLPSRSMVEWEIFYNKADIFKRLMDVYIFLGAFILILQFFILLVPRFRFTRLMKILYWCFALLFLCHGVGLGLRWYLSGHAPWSNGYEAVVFIAFITSGAGLLFSRRNKTVLGATAILAWLMLFVAHMNSLDPEITNLVPVLKSYWLMIHVAIITGSYGFLGLGAIISLLILLMKLFVNSKNKDRILLTASELTHISEMTITIGLFMLTIGTFLGGVWANESWGRYWGWDSKETWALASAITYAMILHFRFIPFLKSEFTFNTAGLWAYSTIIMTFFGVNFYLSGLHSYAQGDPIPIPFWVPVTVVALILLNVVSYLRYRRVVSASSETKEIT